MATTRPARSGRFDLSIPPAALLLAPALPLAAAPARRTGGCRTVHHSEGGNGRPANPVENFEALALPLGRQQAGGRPIRRPSVPEGIAKGPAHRFVPADVVHAAYEDG